MYLLCFDPGLATGVAVFENEKLIHQEVIESGCEGFIKEFPIVYEQYATENLKIIVERFIPSEHVQGEDGIHSNRIEGAIMAYTDNRDIIWQLRSDKVLLFNQKNKLAKGETERFQWLRNKGFTGSSHELDAITHGLVYLKKMRHEPAIRKYWLS